MSEQHKRPAPFAHAADCSIVFLRDNDHFSRRQRKVLVDIFQITVGTQKYEFQMMNMKGSKDGWVFGSFKKHDKEVWSFRKDVRVQEDGFRGGVYTYVYKDTTYALFTRGGILHHVVPFVEMLQDPGFDPEFTDDDEECFAHYRVMHAIAKESGLRLNTEVQEVLDEENQAV